MHARYAALSLAFVSLFGLAACGGSGSGLVRARTSDPAGVTSSSAPSLSSAPPTSSAPHTSAGTAVDPVAEGSCPYSAADFSRIAGASWQRTLESGICLYRHDRFTVTVSRSKVTEPVGDRALGLMDDLCAPPGKYIVSSTGAGNPIICSALRAVTGEVYVRSTLLQVTGSLTAYTNLTSADIDQLATVAKSLLAEVV